MSLQALFEAALALHPNQRDAYLAKATPDPAVRAQILAMLRVDARLDGMESATPGIDVGQWAAMLSATKVRPGDMIGPFRVCEPLGQGGMGVVFRAERDEPKQQVAIKIVRGGELDALYRQRFDLERQALAALDHPYIARLIDANALADGTPYYVMEYVSGLALDRYCTERRLSVRDRVRLMLRICQAVAHAHRHLIVHRDLKPSNILIDADGLPKLLDFGIAKRLGGDALADTGTAQRFFSPRYAAPEQFRGHSASVGTDIYALGVLLFETLTGRLPFDFDGLSLGEIDRLIATVAAPAPSARAHGNHIQRELRGDLDGIVQKCLRKSPDERYESVPQLTEDLNAWLDGLPVRARGGHQWYRLRKFIARHRLAASIGAFSLLALGAAAALLWQQNLALRQQRDLAQRALTMMQDAFTAADPMRAAGAEVTARQILESARRKLEPLAAEQPALFVTLARTIASVDVSLGRGEQASELLGQARMAAAAAEIEDADSELALMHARALTIAKRLPEAQELLDDIATRGHQGAAWLSAQGRLWSRRGDHSQAVSILENAMQALSARPPGDELATTTRYALAEARGVAGDNTGELREIDAILAWQKSSLAADHPQLIVTRMRRLVALYLAAQMETAVAEAQLILEDVRTIYGENAAEAASVYNTLGQALGSLKRVDEALDAYRQAHAISSRAAGRDATNTLRMHFNLAHTLAAAGRAGEAELEYRELLQLAEKRRGGANATVAYYRMQAALLQLSLKRPEVALTILTAEDWQLGWAELDAGNRKRYRLALRDACGSSPDEICTIALAFVAS